MYSIFLEEERIVEEMKWKVVERDRWGVYWPQSKVSSMRRWGLVKRKSKTGRERRKGRKSRTHRGRTLTRGTDMCCSAFLAFLPQKDRKKNPPSICTCGSVEASAAPYSRSNLTWNDGWWITMSVAQCHIMPSLSRTHNKHTPSPGRLNHTAHRGHINYRCTLNYFHYLACSVDRTRRGVMDGKGPSELPQVVTTIFYFVFSNPFLIVDIHFCSPTCGSHGNNFLRWSP